jgi:hypothetical protein
MMILVLPVSAGLRYRTQDSVTDARPRWATMRT